MDWQEIIKGLRMLRDNFDKSYKCLNMERFIKNETVVQHLSTLFDKFERFRVIINEISAGSQQSTKDKPKICFLT